MIDWTPTRSGEIAQCVRTLVATEPGSVPFARGLGVDAGTDAPSTAATQRLRAATVRAVKTYEPRAAVRRIAVQADAEGRMVPSVTIEEVQT